jgi:ribonucleoside-diphosphate reductase alpha chain
MELIPIAHEIWSGKYRFGPETSIEQTWRRVANALSQAESVNDEAGRQAAEDQFYAAMEDFKFIPGGRILAGAGTSRNVSLFNCFVLGTIPDSMHGIFSSLHDAAITQQQGGGIGMDFSTLRPRYAKVKGTGADASGPVSFMDCWDAMCGTIISAGARRGAMIGVLACWHPDIEEFVEAKRDPDRFRNFNISVAVTEEFMKAVKEDKDWKLVFDDITYKVIGARELWKKIMQSAYDCAEPGVIFIDRVNQENNLGHLEVLSASNPCGEQMLPPNGACLLGSLNLTAFVKNPFAAFAGFAPQSFLNFDIDKLKFVTATAVRMLDNVIDVSRYPLKEQELEAKAKRRIGLGITGLGDALAMMGLHYASKQALEVASIIMRNITTAAYETSVRLAEEKGPFPALGNGKEYMERPFIKRIRLEMSNGGSPFEDFGIRNSHLTSIAPTGTISLLGNNISSGVEPIFGFEYERRLRQHDGSMKTERVVDFAVAKFAEMYGSDVKLPSYFVKAHDLPPRAHLAMMAVLQPWVDSSISKTINCPENIPFETFESIYREADLLGLKACATYRPNRITGAILSAVAAQPEQKREPDLSSEPEAWKEPDAKSESTSGSEPESLNGPTIKREPEVRSEPIAQREPRTLSEPGRLREPQYPSEPEARRESEKPDEPLMPRPACMAGRTYKVKWPPIDAAFYVTINDIEEDGERRPYEIFVNSKHLDSYPWIVALTRMISAIWRRGGDTDFVQEELKAVFAPGGGAWIEGKYVPSLVAMIGNVIEVHIGHKITSVNEEAEAYFSNTAGGVIAAMQHIAEVVQQTKRSVLARCPKCGSLNLRHKPGCIECLDCGFSNCE